MDDSEELDENNLNAASGGKKDRRDPNGLWLTAAENPISDDDLKNVTGGGLQQRTNYYNRGGSH